MKELFDKILTWVKSNVLLAIGVLLVIIIVFFPKMLRGLFGTTRRRHRRTVRPVRSRGYYRKGRRVSPRTFYRRPRRSLPRSVGTSRRRHYTKGGKVKKPWQIKGSIAARRHMAKIRRMR